MKTKVPVNRRAFLKVSALASGALLIGVGYRETVRAAHHGKKAKTWAPNLYVRIDPDGKITIISNMNY